MSGQLTNLSQSKFFIDIKNELELDYKRVRGDLLALSLSKPSNYYELRTSVISNITETMVQQAYITFWALLRNGQIMDATGSASLQLEYTPLAGTKMSPFFSITKKSSTI
jgi:hypothetical protein